LKKQQAEEDLRKRYQVLDNFRPAYSLLTAKFPNEDAKSIIMKYERTVEYLADSVKTVDKLE
jgi:hypothetical protein